MFVAIKKKFKDNPLLYYALSICATWAGIGSLMMSAAGTKPKEEAICLSLSRKNLKTIPCCTTR